MFHLLKKIVVTSSLFILVHSEQDAKILSYTNNLRNDRYDFAFNSSDGISRSETGVISSKEEGNVLTVMGEYSYISPDETPVHVSYVAGEGGFRPKFTIGEIKMPPKIPSRLPATTTRPTLPPPVFNSLSGGGLTKNSMAMVIPKFTRPSVMRMLAKMSKKMLKLSNNSKISPSLNDLLTIGKKYKRRQAYYFYVV